MRLLLCTIMLLLLLIIQILLYGCNGEVIEDKQGTPVNSEEIECIPKDYEILHNGEQYAIKVWGKYIFDLHYDTIEEAINFAINHHKELQIYELTYYEWELIDVCIDTENKFEKLHTLPNKFNT